MKNSARSVLCLPYAPILGKPRQNQTHIMAIAAALAENPNMPDVVVLPELALSGYLLESLTSIVPLTYSELSDFAQALAHSGVSSNVEWIVGLPLRDGNAIYNVAAVLFQGQVKHLHRKMHLPTYGMFDEGRYFAAGKELNLYDGILGKTAILICEDAWHPELAHSTAVAGAESVIVISASPARGITSRPTFASTEHWRHRLHTYVASYGQNYIYCNLGGVEDGILFDGNCFAITQAGQFLEPTAHAAYEGATVFVLPSCATARVALAGTPQPQGIKAIVN